MERASNVDDYIANASAWKDSLILLRKIFQSTELKESIKWGMPVYTLNKKNVAGFSSVLEIMDNRETILAYLKEAILHQEQGKEIKPDRNQALEIPEELDQAFKQEVSLFRH